MKKLFFYFLFLIFLVSCNTIKYVRENERLLTKNSIYIDSTKTSQKHFTEYLTQKPNSKVIGIPLPLYFYNLGNPKGSEDVNEWKKNHPKWYNLFKNVFSKKQSYSVAQTFINFNHWFLKNGEAPVIIDKSKTKKTVKNLQTYYQTQGFFDAKAWYEERSVGKRKGKILYYVHKGKPSFLDTIYTNIQSSVLDTIYKKSILKSRLKSGSQYKNENFIDEANRLVKLFRNKGIYHFSENNILFELDSLKNNKKITVDIRIDNRLEEDNGEYVSKPFHIQKIKNINVFTDYSYATRNDVFKDTVSHQKIKYLAKNKLKFNPKYLSQSLFIKPNQIYTDSLLTLTKKHLRGLKNFKTISVRYQELSDDELEANIFLTPIEKYTLGVNTELSRSNIRDYDISAEFSLSNRNTFRGAEILQLTFSGSYFSSQSVPGWEVGTNLSLEVPRFMMPFGLNKLVPKRMFPKTRFYVGTSIQRNIALDKQNISLGFDYHWDFSDSKNIHLELFNLQYIRNLNANNYFNIYQSEYNKLKGVANVYNPSMDFPNNTSDNVGDIIQFMNDRVVDGDFLREHPLSYQDNINVFNRHRIITSDFLIPVIAYSFTYNNREGVTDNNFSYFKIRLANSGNLVGLLSGKQDKNKQKTVFKIPVAQYFKIDLEYKKFWNISENAILANRFFLGAIIPYNGSRIPFSKSYFAGGSNDIRAWKTYAVGPGRRIPGLEYNIGNLKFLGSFEYRFDVIGSFKSALFIDAGNIWDITNSSFVDEESKLSQLKSAFDMVVGAGVGFRYDFKFMVARFDIGFKAREPYLINKRWFQNFNFENAVYNIGINYPF